MILFKYVQILLQQFSTDSGSTTFTFIFNIIASPKITHSYWFIKILFFFMLNNIPNFSKYSVFNCFIFFFKSKKISYIICFFLFCFFILKIFLTSLIMLSSIFYFLQVFKFSSLYIVKKISFFLKV